MWGFPLGVLLMPLENTLPSPICSYYITQGSLAHVPLQWGKQAHSPAPFPLPHPLTLTHTPPVMFAGLRKESINSDLVAVSCGPLCEVLTFGE